MGFYLNKVHFIKVVLINVTIMSGFVTVEKHPHHAVIKLDRPKRKNALVASMFAGICSHLASFTKDDSIKLVVLTGTGEYFSSGADFSGGGDKKQQQQGPEETIMNFKEFAVSLIKFPKPLIAAVNGPAIGVAVTCLALCDAVWASDNATFMTPFSQNGVTPECCSSYTFPKIMGYALASEVLLFNRTLNAQEALRSGLVGEVFPKDVFQSKVEERIQEYIDNPVKSLIYGKELIRGGEREHLLKVNDIEVDRLMERYASEDVINQMMKFIAKRKAIREKRMHSKL